MFEREYKNHTMTNYDKYLNNSIPYMVSPEMSQVARQKVADIIENLPFKDRMLPLLDIFEISKLRALDAGTFRQELRRIAREGDVLARDLPESLEPLTTEEFLKRRPKKGKAFTPESKIEPQDLGLIFKTDILMQKQRPAGGYLRNFIWRTSLPDMFGVWDNFYPAAVYFEPALPDPDVSAFVSLPLINNICSPEFRSPKLVWIRIQSKSATCGIPTPFIRSLPS